MNRPPFESTFAPWRRRVVLDNGLAVIVAPRAGSVVSVQTWYAVGSADDPTGKTGLAHLLEHMMFKGAEKFGKGAIDRATFLRGGGNNAFTNCDSTVYQFDLPATDWTIALDIEADRMRDLRLDASEFEAERRVVLEEGREHFEYPESRLVRAADAMTFADHGYGHPVMGHAEDVAALTREDAAAFYERWYRPERAAIVIAGDVDADEAIEEVASRFSFGESGDPNRGRERAAPQPGAGRIEHDDPVGVARLYLQFPGLEADDPQAVPLDALEHVLTGGRNSLLFRRLVRETAVASSVGAENDPRLDPGVFWIEATASEGADPAALEAAVFEALERIARDGPDPDRLDRTRHALRVDAIFGRETPWDLAETWGDAEMASGYRAHDLYLEDVAALTPADVAAACAAICTRDRATVAWSLPEAR